MYRAVKNGHVYGTGSTLEWAERIACVLGRGTEIHVITDTGASWRMWVEGLDYCPSDAGRHHLFVVVMRNLRRRRMTASQ